MTNRRTLLAGAGAALPLMLARTSAFASGPYWPGDGIWATATPAEAGFDPAALSAAVSHALADQSLSVLVLRGGRIVAEAYGDGWGPDKSSQLASAAKSVLSVLVGICIDQGHIKSVDQSAADFIPWWRNTPKQAITIRHLLTMTSGLDFNGLKLRDIAGDQFQIDASSAIDHAPGTAWAYATPMFHLLYHVVERATGEDFRAFAQRVLIGPLGMEHWSWLTNVGQGEHGPVTNYYTAICSGRDLARFGLFALRGGRWNGQQLVNPDYFKASTSPSQALNPSYGYLWWVNAKPGVDAFGRGPSYRFAGSPPDTFGALGAGGQVAIETPSLDLVVVRQGQQPRDPEMITRLQAEVVKAVRA